MPHTESKAYRAFLAIALIVFVLAPQIVTTLGPLIGLLGIKPPQLWGTVEAQTQPPTGRNFTVTLQPGDALFFNWFTWVFRGDGYIQAPYFSVFNNQSFTVATAVALNNYSNRHGIFLTGDSYSTDRLLRLAVISYTYPYLGFNADDLLGSSMSLSNLSFVHLIYSWNQPSKYQYIYVNSSLSRSRVSSGYLSVTSGSATGYGSWIGRTPWEWLQGYMFYLSIFNVSTVSANVSPTMFLQGYMNFSNMVFMISPSFFNGTHYRDLVGGYYLPISNLLNVFLMPTPSWYFNYTIVRGMYSDGYVHLIYTPNVTKMNIYDLSGNLLYQIDFSTYTSNSFGMIEDLPISLSAGTYVISVQSSLTFILGIPKMLSFPSYTNNGVCVPEPCFIPSFFTLKTLYVVDGSPASNVFINVSTGSYYVTDYTDASGSFPVNLPTSSSSVSLNITFFNGMTYTNLISLSSPISSTTIYTNMISTSQLNISPNDTLAPHLYMWYLDGVDDYVVVSASTSLTLSGDFTVCVYIAPLSVYTEWIGAVDNGRNYLANWYFLTVKGASSFLAGIAFTDNTFVEIHFPPETLLTFHHYCFGVSGNNFFGHRDGSFYYSTSFTKTRKVASYPIYIGKRVGHGYYSNILVAQALIYSRAPSDSEIYSVYAYNIINSSDLVLFLDPTFYNGTHFLDLSRYNNHGVGYNGVARIPDNRTWIYLVKNLSSDNLVHLRFFPNNSVLYIYDSSGDLVKVIDFSQYPANPAGMVEDLPISLPAGNYSLFLAFPYAYQRVQMNKPVTVYLPDFSTVVINPPSTPGNYSYVFNKITPTNVNWTASLWIYWDDVDVSSSFSPRYPVYGKFWSGITNLPSNANFSARYISDGSSATPFAFTSSTPSCYSSVGVCTFSYYVYIVNTTFNKPLTASFIVDDVYVSSSSLLGDGSIAPVAVRSVYDNALYNFSYTYYSDSNVSITPIFSGYAFPAKFFRYNVYNVSLTSYSNQSVFLRALAETNVSISVSTSLGRVRLVLTGSPSIYIYLPNISSRNFTVFVDGRLWSNYIASGNILRVYVASTVVDLLVGIPYIAPSSSYVAPSPLSSNVWELGFIDNNSLANYSFRAGALFNTSNALLFINASGSISNKSIAFIPSPSDISLMWSCSNNSFTVWLYAVYTWSGYTQYYVDRLLANVPSCPASLYIYYLAYNGSVFLDRVGGTLGDFQRLLTTGELQLSINGPFSPSTIMRYILVDRPLVIEFQPPVNLSIYPNPLGQGITLRNMKGWLLSYSVSGVSVSNIQISGSSETISIPLGITLLVFVDPTSRTISLVQAAPPPVVARGAQNPQQPLPLPAPQIEMPSISTITDPGIAIPVILGLAAALIIAGRQLTGSIGRGILIATAGMTPLAIALYIVSGNPAYLGLLLTGLALGAAVRFARS